MNLFEMLMLSRKLTFEDGRITLYGHDILIIPAQSFVEYITKISSNPELVKMIYSTAKEAMLECKQDIMKEYDKTNSEKWLCDTINLYGQGRVNYENYSDSLTGTLIMENSFLIKDIINKVEAPADHIIRGIIAGLMSSISDNDLDALEVECQTAGDKKCKFVIEPGKNLKEKFPDLYSKQIGI